MQNGNNEADIIARCRRGDREAFRGLVEMYQPRVYALAYELLRSHEDAQDVTQEAFVKAYLSLAEYRGDATFYTWLYRIVYNMVIDFRRRFARRGGAAVEYDESQVSDIPGTSGHVEAPQEGVLRREQREYLQRAISGLSEEHRAVVMLREVDGLSYEEIAQVTGVSRGTVMSRLHYARKKLQASLSEFSQDVDSGKGGALNNVTDTPSIPNGKLMQRTGAAERARGGEEEESQCFGALGLIQGR